MDNRVNELVNDIKKYAQAYYSGESLISDYEFDELVEELRSLDPENEILNTTGWGFTPKGNKVRHLYNLSVGSLSKCHHASEVNDCLNGKGSFVRISAKLDGLSCVSYYKDGKRFLSLTRGNGTEGQDVTEKINKIDPNSKVLPINFTGAIRGEVLCSNNSWDKIKDRFLDNPSANQRNYASGILNRKDISDELDNLSYVVYKVIADESSNSTDLLLNKVLSKFDNSVPCEFVNNTPSEINEEKFKELYNEYICIYPCDGLVITSVTGRKNSSDGIEYDEVAFKFPAESKEVIVKEVTWNVTRTGRLVPLIRFDSVELSGAQVTKCTGYNAQFILDNRITKGSRIKVMRSGEVIPKIVGRYEEDGTFINLDRNY